MFTEICHVSFYFRVLITYLQFMVTRANKYHRQESCLVGTETSNTERKANQSSWKPRKANKKKEKLARLRNVIIRKYEGYDEKNVVPALVLFFCSCLIGWRWLWKEKRLLGSLCRTLVRSLSVVDGDFTKPFETACWGCREQSGGNLVSLASFQTSVSTNTGIIIILFCKLIK